MTGTFPDEHLLQDPDAVPEWRDVASTRLIYDFADLAAGVDPVSLAGGTIWK